MDLQCTVESLGTENVLLCLMVLGCTAQWWDVFCCYTVRPSRHFALLLLVVCLLALTKLPFHVKELTFEAVLAVALGVALTVNAGAR